MALGSNLVKLGSRLPAALAPKRDPRAAWKWALGVLAVANVAAFFTLVRPPGGNLADLGVQLDGLRKGVVRQRDELKRAQDLVLRMRMARAEQDKFISDYFMDRQTASSTILTEIGKSAKEAQLSPREHSFTIEPVEGSDNISMMTISANYEGSYADLVRFVNLMDRSRRFLIIDSISAAPMQEKGRLAARFKMNTFVREMAREGAPQ
jgi:type IV pilus assembly protein PilO